MWWKLFEFVQKDPDLELAIIDSTVVRSHACSAGYGRQEYEALGRSAGGFSAKIHARVDALGNPLKIILTPGNYHDITQAKRLSEGVFDIPLAGDKEYSSKNFDDFLHVRGCEPIIPSKSNSKNHRSYDKHLYKDRHLIE